MSNVGAAIADFMLAAQERPFPIGTPTARIMQAVRRHLDEAAPGWRDIVFVGAPPGTLLLEVEFRMRGGGVIKGVLYQRPSGAAGGMA